MGGKLNMKNFDLMEEWVKKQDLCIAIGSSLVGMTSDDIVDEGIIKFNNSNGEAHRGVVIINNQETS